MTSAGNWSTEYSNYTDKYHYTCFSSSTSCQSVNYIHTVYSENKYAYYFTLTNGKKAADLLSDMLEGNVNVKDSTSKSKIDEWYKTNMTSYTSQLEDIGFCNDRTYYNFDTSGWNKDYSNYNKPLYFSVNYRLFNKTPSLVCPRQIDKFTVSTNNGNGALTYPVGLITAEEMAFAGGVVQQTNASYYLYNGINNWTMSPYYFSNWGSLIFYLDSIGAFGTYYGGGLLGIRPVVSLKKGTVLSSGNGSTAAPYIVG